MELSETAALDLEAEHRRTVRACLAGGTTFILLANVWCVWQYHQLLTMSGILENMVVVAFFSLSGILWMWISVRKISRIVYLTTALMAFAFLTGLFFEIAGGTPLRTVISNFAP